MNHDILSMNLVAIEKLMVDLNQPTYRAKQIFEWLHKKNVTSFAEMSNLSKSLREALEKICNISSMNMINRRKSKNDDTIKYLFSLNDGSTIESVLMRYSHGYSVCVSTQVGCKMGCTFCASGEDFVRNLTAGEICAQIYAINRENVKTQASKDHFRISNIVLMGCGEPLDNFASVIQSIVQISHPNGLNIGQRHFTLSTCGLVPQILELAKMKMQITLAVSLHAPNDEIRQKFMPIAKRYKLNDLISACHKYVRLTNRRITFEYALAKGVNDSPAQAKELVVLLKGMNCHVNLIPINKARGEFTPTSRKDAQAFVDNLQESGIQTTVRRSLGGDVDAACGQLRARHNKGGFKFEKS